MKAIVAISCFLFVSFTHVAAQRWTFSAGIGPAIPVGEYGSKDITDSRAAFARTGPVLQLTAAYRVARHWGVSVLTSGGWNRVNTQKMDDALEALNKGDRFAVTSDPWIFVTLMGGLYGEWSLNKRWSFTVQGYAGVLETKRPKYSVVDLQPVTGTPIITGSAEDDWMEDINKVQTGFAFQAGAGLSYALGRRFFLSGRLEYAMAWYKAVGASSNTGVVLNKGGVVTLASGTPPTFPTPTGAPSYVQPISTLNPTVGVGIHI